MILPPPPTVGQIVTIRGITCRIIKIRPLGTIDVETCDRSRRAFRVTGLAWRKP